MKTEVRLMRSIKISILVPAYNSENTISKCLDSLIGQSYENMEIMVLDDGSNDKTFDIVNEYKKSSNKIVALHQENQGVAVTRQRLIEHADGDFILFCDADDHFNPNAVEIIADILRDHDVDAVLFGYDLIRTRNVKTVKKLQLDQGLYNIEVFKRHHTKNLDNLYWSVLWNKCYKKTIMFDPKEIQFCKNMEDVIFNIEYFQRCNNIFITDNVLYNYVEIGESLTRNSVKDNKGRVLSSLETSINVHNAVTLGYEDVLDNVDKFVFGLMDRALNRAKKLKDNDLYEQIKDNEVYRKIRKTLGCKINLIVLRSYWFSCKGRLRKRFRT